MAPAPDLADLNRHQRQSQSQSQAQIQGKAKVQVQFQEPLPQRQTPATADTTTKYATDTTTSKPKPRFTSPVNLNLNNLESSPFPAGTDQGFDAVTPGIELATYHHFPDSSPQDSPSYFSSADPNSPSPAIPHHDLSKRSPRNRNNSATMNRRESLSEIRAANPDLSLSGNIISATFTPTHTFTYRKGGQWVSVTLVHSTTLRRRS